MPGCLLFVARYVSSAVAAVAYLECWVSCAYAVGSVSDRSYLVSAVAVPECHAGGAWRGSVCAWSVEW
jgi:hypothetical protein